MTYTSTHLAGYDQTRVWLPAGCLRMGVRLWRKSFRMSLQCLFVVSGGIIIAPIVAPAKPREPDHLVIEVKTPEERGRQDEPPGSGTAVGDIRPARIFIDFRQITGRPDVRINPQSLQLRKLGAAETLHASGPPVPLRFDDPDPKPGSFYHHFVGGGGVAGDLVFQHTVDGETTTRYLLTFETLRSDSGPAPASPTPPIGDYDILRYASGGPLSGVFHTKVATADWDGDGHIDIVAGDILGRITLYRGQREKPLDFDAPVRLEAGGEPIMVDGYAAPDIADWDGDGDLDLICGVESARGNVLFFENIGERDSPRLQKPIRLGDDSGKPIISPYQPSAESPYATKDYVPCPDIVDYDGDGRIDLVLGGYVTGHVYLYRNIATSNNSPPRLKFRDALHAESEPIDATFAAAPELADLDGDGDLDLVIGHIAEHNKSFHWRDAPSVLFYENTGTRERPVWKERTFPLEEQWTEYLPNVTVPRLIDFDGDGDLDLFLSGRCEVFFFENIGSRSDPRFVYRRRLTMSNGPLLVNYKLNAVAPCMGDLNGDELPDLILGGSGSAQILYMKKFTTGSVPRFDDGGLLEADGKPIYHDFIHGDDTAFPFLIDWDMDSDLDLIMGDGAGYVTLYRNDGTRTAHQFAPGMKLVQQDGLPLCVGEPPGETASDFESQAGNRSVPAPADFDGDGMLDLICGNAAGKVLFYRQRRNGRFAEPVEIAQGSGRCFAWPVDWNSDSVPDVILSWAGSQRAIYINKPGNEGALPQFEDLSIEDMPWIPYPRPMAIDWNRDGDTDILFASSYALVHFVERDFLQNGYIEANVVDP